MPALMTQLITLIKQLSPASYHLYFLYVVQGGYGKHFQQTKFLLQFVSRLGDFGLRLTGLNPQYTK